MVATTLRAGDIAIVGYNTEDLGNPDKDTISFVLMRAIGSGTQIFFTDRNWNGTAFPGASADESTFTYTAGADLAAGTIVHITTAQLNAAGIDLVDTGETIYAYQGAINAPTTFLFAADVADGNNTFNGNLTGTGLSVAANTAVALDEDNGSWAGRGHNHNPIPMLDSIADHNDWVGNNNSMQVAHTGNFANTPDQQLWAASSGGGHALVRIDRDGGSFTGEEIVHIYQNSADAAGTTTVAEGLFHPSDIVFDTVGGKMFVADSDGNGHNRIVQFDIATLQANPGAQPVGTILYQDANVGTGIVSLTLDKANGLVYFGSDDGIYRIDYNTTNQTPELAVFMGTNVFVQDFVLNLDAGGNGTAYIVNSSINVSFGADNITRNFIYQSTGLTPTSTTVAANATQMEMDQNDTDVGGVASTNPDAQAFPKEYGVIKGIHIDPVTDILYFTTMSAALDHDGDGSGGTPAQTQFGGIWSYATISNPTGVYSSVWRQDGVNGTDGLIYYIEVDTVNDKYYLSDITGGPGAAADNQEVWVGNLSGGAPTLFSTVANIQGLTPLGLDLQNAPTRTAGNSLAAAVTEASSAPGSGNTNSPLLYSALAFSDVDTAGGDELTGALVRISNNFQFGVTHQDQLRISNNLSGTIGGSGINYNYDATTGQMTLTGVATVAEYAAALNLVTFNTGGDDVTAFGSATSRTVSASVFDGLLYSDEIHTVVTVTGINDAPVNLVPGAQAFNEDTARVFSTANLNALSTSDVDADPAAQALLVTLSVTQGTLTLGSTTGLLFSTGDGTGDSTMIFTGTANAINAALGTSLTYNPIADYNGGDTLTFTVNDQGFNGNDPGNSGTGTTEQDSETIAITINPIVDIANDTVNIGEDAGAQTLNLLANDSFENPGRAITAVGTASNGTVTINDNATVGDLTDDFVVYTANADFNGSDSFTYTVTSGGVTEQATVTVNIAAVVDIAADTVNLAEDAGATQLDLLANDSFENPGRAITAVGTALHGTVAINDNGTLGDATDDYVVYTPTADYEGADSFTYTVTSGGVTEQATVTVNLSAVADIADDGVTVDEDSGTTQLDLLANDSFENPGRAITAVGSAANGTTAINDNGTLGDLTDDYVTYTPDGDYNGSDTFTYTVTSGGVTEQATVTVTVTAVNDAPVNLLGSAVAINEDDSSVALAGMSVDDVDAPGDISYNLAVDHGTLTIAIVAGGIQLSDIVSGNGTGGIVVLATVAEINTTLAANGLTYTPVGDFNGADTLQVYVNDAGQTGSDPNPVSILDPFVDPDIGPTTEEDYDERTINVAAVADIADDTVNLAEDAGATQLDLLANDSFENPGRAITAVGSALHGTVAIDDNGTVGDLTDDYVVYTPDADYNGSDSFTYTVTSGGVTEQATVNVNLSAVADIADDSVNVDEDSGSNQLDLLANDSFEDSGRAITAVGTATHGTVAIDDNGTAGDATDDFVTYTTNDPDYNGSDSFTYTVTAGGLTETATVTVAVDAVADIANDSVNVLEDSGANALDLLANDSFEDSDRAITAVGAATNGTTAIDDNGTAGDATDDFVTYTPNAGYDGPDSFTYTVTAGGVTETATVNVSVIVPNVPPVVDMDGADASIDFATSYNENAAGVAIGNLIGVSDADAGDQIESATIALSSSVTGDLLSVSGVLPSGISIDTVNSTDDFLVLIGAASAADYATALGQVRFSSSSEDPTDGGAAPTRTIGVTVNDGAANSLPATVTITINPSDDLGTAVDDSEITDEDTPVPCDVTLNDSDPDNGLTVAAVNGAAFTSGVAFLLPSGGELTMNSDGTFVYDPNNAFDDTPTLGSGASNTPASDSFTYTLFNGGTATVTITIVGLDSNDLLLGSPGLDNLAGGIGDDKYVVGNTGDTVSEASGEGTDTVSTAVDYTLALGSEVEQLNAISFAATTPLKLTGNEIANTIAGNAGNNLLDGRGDADTMIGLGGNDQFVVDDSSDVVVEAAGGGNDVVSTLVDYQLAPGSEIERLTSISWALTTPLELTGNGIVNLIEGNAGDNLLDGRGGADILKGFGGDDQYVVDNAGDVVVEAVGGGNDVVSTLVDYQLGPSSEVERLTSISWLLTTPLTLIGNGIANLIEGNAGDNLIDGRIGADALKGFGGDDKYIVDNAGDVAVELAGNGNDTVITLISYALAVGSEVERLSAISWAATDALTLTGNEIANTILANAGNNVLNGGVGADTMFGFGGDDKYIVDDAGDLVVELTGGGNDSVSTVVDYALAAGSEVERLTSISWALTTPLTLVGNSIANQVEGNAGNNYIDGRGGGDRMFGFGGDDRYVVYGAGDEALETSGNGEDIVYAVGDHSLTANSHIEALSAIDWSFTTALRLEGNNLANKVVGNAGDNYLDGRGGTDRLVGFDGADTFAFTTALGAGNIDRVVGFQTGDDGIELDDAVFTALSAGALPASAFVVGTGATDGDDRIVYNQTTGALVYDADGLGGVAGVQFATLDAGTVLAASDFSVI